MGLHDPASVEVREALIARRLQLQKLLGGAYTMAKYRDYLQRKAAREPVSLVNVSTDEAAAEEASLLQMRLRGAGVQSGAGGGGEGGCGGGAGQVESGSCGGETERGGDTERSQRGNGRAGVSTVTQPRVSAAPVSAASEMADDTEVLPVASATELDALDIDNIISPEMREKVCGGRGVAREVAASQYYIGIEPRHGAQSPSALSPKWSMSEKQDLSIHTDMSAHTYRTRMCLLTTRHTRRISWPPS